MNAIITANSHIQRAIDFWNKPDLYFAIGGTTAWPNDSIPPIPDPTMSQLDTIIGFKRVEAKYLVVPDDTNGTIFYRDSTWRVTSAAEAFNEQARWVYLTSILRYDELPLLTYRQIGVYTGLVPKTGVTKFNLVPSEVESNGTLEIIDFRTPQPRQLDQREQLSLIIQF